MGCKDKPEERRAPPPNPPPSASAASKACANGGGSLKDPAVAAIFPRSSGGYCLDPNGEVRSFGEGSPKPLDAVCTEAFDGACDQYKSFGLRSVTQFHYVDGAGSSGSVEVVLSKFATPDGAYGMFTSRVVGDNDPAADKFPRDMKLPGASAQGTGTVYLWKGQLFVELTYTNETETPKQLAETSSKVLTVLSGEIAPKLPGVPSLPVSAAALPADRRLPLGMLYEPKDAFEVSGAGGGAYGFYKDGEKRYRVLSITRNDADQAKDVFQSIAKRKGATKEKEPIGDGVLRVMTGDKDSPRVEWVVARSGKQILGVGDETLVLKSDASAADHDKVCLSKEQKLALVKTLLSTVK
ncbi:MAG: hypothetical protein HY898_31085 [Deltaproteobacteria bacterium]|nr:hypothetical protein [Deltaproteobacteria bacterium]